MALRLRAMTSSRCSGAGRARARYRYTAGKSGRATRAARKYPAASCRVVLHPGSPKQLDSQRIIEPEVLRMPPLSGGEHLDRPGPRTSIGEGLPQQIAGGRREAGHLRPSRHLLQGTPIVRHNRLAHAVSPLVGIGQLRDGPQTLAHPSIRLDQDPIVQGGDQLLANAAGLDGGRHSLGWVSQHLDTVSFKRSGVGDRRPRVTPSEARVPMSGPCGCEGRPTGRPF